MKNDKLSEPRQQGSKEFPVVAIGAAAGGSDRRIFELAAGMENIIRV